jgi:hypothetical protein
MNHFKKILKVCIYSANAGRPREKVLILAFQSYGFKQHGLESWRWRPKIIVQSNPKFRFVLSAGCS